MRQTLVLAAGLGLLATTLASAAVNVGDKAPNVEVGKWLNLPSGVSKLSLSDLKGQVVMVEFWATW